ncbi:MAG: hypothetical protein IPJ82_03315 [Lewinellaceae bacterium]|nr:hypothetical protein [Lewinellaceae bacterium]
MHTMKSGSDLFAEFPPVSKAEWIKKIVKDLKDRPLEDLDWQMPEGLRVSPLVHADDFQEPPLPMFSQSQPWEICEEVAAGDPAAANRQSLDALEGGVEGLQFHLEQTPDASFLAQMFDGIHPDYIGLHFSGPGVSGNPGAVLAGLESLAKTKGISTANLRGSLAFDPASAAGIVDWRYLADLLVYTREKFPGFKLVTISASTDGGGETQQGPGLAPLLQKGNRYLEQLTHRGIPAAEAAGTMLFQISAGQRYFFEIARIRAFKLLWINVLKAWNAPLKYPDVAVCFNPAVYSDDLYTNMIRGTTMAMSAVLGGADHLTVLPYDAGRTAQATYPQTFSRRIARNVQHLLKMESGFDQVADPAAGSYYIEKLTLQVAEQAWEEAFK